MGFTADNAENNATLIRELEALIPTWSGRTLRVRCFGHVLNLIVKVRTQALRQNAMLTYHPPGYPLTTHAQ